MPSETLNVAIKAAVLDVIVSIYNFYYGDRNDDIRKYALTRGELQKYHNDELVLKKFPPRDGTFTVFSPFK